MNYKITYPTQLQEVKVDNDNIDVCVSCDNEDVFTFVVATIENVKLLLEDDVLNPNTKLLIVNKLTRSNIEKVIKMAIQDKKIYYFYGLD